MKIVFLIFLLIPNFSRAESAWEYARKNPDKVLAYSRAIQIASMEEQVSCEHLEFRYSQVMSLLSDLAWLMEKDVFENTSGRMDAHDYIQKRLGVDARAMAGKDVYEFQFDVEGDFFEDEGVNSIAFISNTHFELFTPNEYLSDNLNLEKKESSEKYRLTVKANTIDICLNGYVEILQLKNCPSPLSENQDACTEGGLCASPITHDWKSCKDVEVLRLDFVDIRKKLGVRTQKISVGVDL